MNPTYISLLVVGVIATLGTSIGTVYAQGEDLAIVSSIFASEYVQLSIVIVLIGVAIRTWAGLIGKSLMDVNVNRVVFTFVISLLTSINIVMPVLQQIDPTASPEIWFVALIGAVLTVIGSDSVGKAVMKQVKTVKAA